jgi:hypothetical protein
MFNFCTLFDTYYLTRGLALYESLEQHCPEFHLYIFAFNDQAYHILNNLKLKHATIISLKEFEDEELLKIKPTRNIAEYCWTSTSSTILYVLNNYKVNSCTYLDADLYFYSSPEPIFQEMGNASILITEHRYSPQYNKELKSGKYCVQFVTFKNDERALKALKWWRDRCIEWCYARYEDGKFGDQLYLEDWTTRFEGVHVMKHLGGGLAAWNVQQYNFTCDNNKIYGIEITTGKKFEAIFYHYHYLRFIGKNKIEMGRRILSEDVLKLFYIPYIKKLLNIKEKIWFIDSSFDPNGPSPGVFSWKTPILYIYRKLFGIYNIYKVEDLIRR